MLGIMIVHRFNRKVEEYKRSVDQLFLFFFDFILSLFLSHMLTFDRRLSYQLLNEAQSNFGEYLFRLLVLLEINEIK